MFRFRSSKMFVVVLIVMVLATAAYAFAESNTMPATSHAGEGEVVIGGYVVSNVTYTYDTANPSMLSFVDFDIAPAVTKVGVSLIAGDLLTDCGAASISAIAGGSHVQCPVNVSVLNADMLRVVSSD